MRFLEKVFKKVWEDIYAGQNLDVYITLVIASIVAVLGVNDPSKQSIVSSAILATLGLISIGLLTNRQENEQIRQTLEALARSSESPRNLLMQNYNSSLLKQPLRDEVNQLLFLAVNGTSTFPLIKNDLEIGLQRGLDAKFIFVEPFSEAARMHAFRNRHQSEDEVNTILQTQFSRLRSLAKLAPPGKLEVRVINYLPPFNIYAFDPQSASGKMYVRIMTFRSSSDARPVLELTYADDKQLFEFFIEQFNLIWKESNFINLLDNQ